jgi:hypothetical protein
MGSRPISALIECSVALGTFSQERVVIVRVSDGREVAAIVSCAAVSADREPHEEEWLPGRLRVAVLESNNGSTLVGLPGEAVAGGSRYRIPTRRLEFEPNGDT